MNYTRIQINSQKNWRKTTSWTFTNALQSSAGKVRKTLEEALEKKGINHKVERNKPSFHWWLSCFVRNCQDKYNKIDKPIKKGRRDYKS